MLIKVISFFSLNIGTYADFHSELVDFWSRRKMKLMLNSVTCIALYTYNFKNSKKKSQFTLHFFRLYYNHMCNNITLVNIIMARIMDRNDRRTS